MSTLARSRDDLILDGLKSKIESHRDADVIINAVYNFNVERDVLEPWQGARVPTVNLEQETDEGKAADFSARYHALCIVPVPAGAKNSDAVARLYVLKEQVKKALLDRADYDIGQPKGTISKLGSLSWRRVKFDDDKLNEDILAGEWSFEVGYGYEPLDLTLIPLESISASLGDLAALYHF